MPSKPKHPCNKIGCPNLTTERFCEVHAAQYQKEIDSKRGTSTQRGYGVNHRKLRKIVLSEEPLCRHCAERGKTTPATDMDHIDGNVYNLRRDNLQGLCGSCHKKKTIKEQGALKR